MKPGAPSVIPVRPQGIKQVRLFFGNPDPFRNDDGTISPKWEQQILMRVPLPASIQLGWDHDALVRAIRCHRALGPNVEALFAELHHEGLWRHLRTFDGCYAWRANRRDAKRLSLHCWGAAMDLNASTNKLGADGDQPEELIAVFKRFGWFWGGEFSNPDPMHFQFAEGV